jgi:RNA-directed DNA polymerase
VQGDGFAMTLPYEPKPSSVSATAKQDGDIRARWAWTERAVWTARMLTALEQGVKGGVWFSLMDKVYSEGNLLAAYDQVASNDGAPGVDHITTERFGHDLDANLEKLAEPMRDGTYDPQDIRRVWIPKPGSDAKRPLGIPTVRDRVVQAALLNTIEPIFEREFSEHSYGFRPGLGGKDALREVDALLKDGYQFVVDADLKSYFDTIPHDQLLIRIRERISDGRILALVESFLKAGILSELGREEPWMGAPQGAVVSPLLSNIYLNPLDHLMVQEGMRMVRYADDFVILCRSREDAERALTLVRDWTASAGLTLHPTKTRLVDVREEEFTFLGYSFSTSKDGHIRRWPGKKSLTKFKETIRTKTRRNHGDSLEQIIAEVNETLRGWFGYFKHSYATTFPYLDGWIRRRLRNILCKRQGRQGIGNGLSNLRWPNAYFTGHGLFSLETAHRLACQPSLR